MMSGSLQHFNQQSGNILFLILISVALFAALSYAVTHSARSGGDDIREEQNELMLSEIVQYATLVENAILRLMVSNGCTDEEISFENDIFTIYTNSNAPADGSCHVFHPDGAGLSFAKPPEEISKGDGSGSVPHKYSDETWPYIFAGTWRIQEIGRDTTPDGNDLVMFLPIQSLSLCTLINEQFADGAPIYATTALHGSSATYQPFTGTYAAPDYTHTNTTGLSTACREAAAAFPGTVGIPYFFYHVILQR